MYLLYIEITRSVIFGSIRKDFIFRIKSILTINIILKVFTFIQGREHLIFEYNLNSHHISQLVYLFLQCLYLHLTPSHSTGNRQ